MSSIPRPAETSSAMSEAASLLMWVRAARVIVLAAGVVAAIVGLALVSKDRRVEGLMIGVAGVAAAVLAQVIIGYVAWRVHASLERHAPAPTTGVAVDGRADLGGVEPIDGA